MLPETNKKNINKGFTLMELVVVIAIIGLLAGVTIVATSSVRVKARDAKRKSDLLKLQTALTVYYAENRKFPTCPGTADSTRVCTSSTGASGTDWESSFKTDLAPYLTPVPKDPLNSTATNMSGQSILFRYSYEFISTTDASADAACKGKYILRAPLETNISSGEYYCKPTGSATIKEMQLVLN